MKKLFLGLTMVVLLFPAVSFAQQTSTDALRIEQMKRLIVVLQQYLQQLLAEKGGSVLPIPTAEVDESVNGKKIVDPQSCDFCGTIIGRYNISGSAVNVSAVEFFVDDGTANSLEYEKLLAAAQILDAGIPHAAPVPVANGRWNADVWLGDGDHRVVVFESGTKRYLTDKKIEVLPTEAIDMELLEPVARPTFIGTASNTTTKLTLQITTVPGVVVYTSTPISVTSNQWKHTPTKSLVKGEYTAEILVDGEEVFSDQFVVY